jgi:hypothetical protein
MKRAIKNLVVLIGFVFAFLSINVCFAQEFLRDYDGIELSKGTFIPVISAQTISTEFLDEGTPVKFIARTDLYLHESNLIPEGTELLGFVAKINEPVVGTNASMVIAVNKIRYSDGFEVPIKAYIYTARNNLIGGELTKPEKYIKMPHYQQGFGMGTMQYVPGPVRKKGSHTVISSGAELMVILAKPAYITHTLIN